MEVFIHNAKLKFTTDGGQEADFRPKEFDSTFNVGRRKQVRKEHSMPE
jgi:hypothetical protein